VTYTQIATLAVMASAVLDVVVLRTRLLGRRTFWVSYLIVLVFQLVVNGVLTGQRIVRYNGADILGSSTATGAGAGTPVFVGDGRLVYAPVEDLMFGFALVLQTLSWWVFWGRRGVQPVNPARRD